MIFRSLLFTFFLSAVLFCPSAFAQKDTVNLTTIINKTIKLGTQYPLEKVYLHLDKPYYAAGDTIWFKAYLTMNPHQPSALSKVTYVELLSSQDSMVQSLRLSVANGIASGDIPLPQGLKQGNYFLRAYTAWMRNFDTDYFFTKTISVGNVIDNPVITHVNYTALAKGSSARINARIVFKDADNNAYPAKKVSWSVELENDKVLKGKGVTDQNGLLNIGIESGKLADLLSRNLVTVIDLGNKKAISTTFALKAADPGTDVQFFPEGGDLAIGVRSRVAFKAIKANGLGIDVQGTVADNDGKVVAEIKSQHLGMGVFFMVPEAGKTYKASITFADGSKNVYDLPHATASGITLAIGNNDADNLNIKIVASQAFFDQNQHKLFYLVAQNGETIYYAAQTPLDNQVYSAAVPKSKFPTGVLQITLFSASAEPVSERIAFIQRNDLLNLSASSAKNTFVVREKVKLNISAKNNGAPVQAGLSVAVIDETKVPYDENAETTILTSILLTSDLKGYIEKPNYYFNHVTEQSAADLDVLMLTQGYRRFSYRDILANKYPRLSYLPEQGIEISGTLRNQTGMPINKGYMRLQVPDKNYSTQVMTDPSGVFRFTKVIIQDSSKVILNGGNNPNNKNLMIMLDVPRSQGLTRNVNEPDGLPNIDSTLHTYLQNSKRQFTNTHLLKEVEIKEKVVVKKASHVDYPALTGLSMEADHEISGERLKDCSNFVSCLQTMVFGLTYDNNNFYVTRDYNAGKKIPVQIYAGGLAVDYNYLNGVNAADVESVEIFLNDGMSGINRMNGTNGVLVINTRKIPQGKKLTFEQAKELFAPKYLLTFIPQGYSVGRVFYSPRYDVARTVQNANDLRTTIYWNPYINTDKTGNASIEFFNADGRGTYKAIVEGMDSDGNIGRFVYRYKVQ